MQASYLLSMPGHMPRRRWIWQPPLNMVDILHKLDLCAVRLLERAGHLGDSRTCAGGGTLALAYAAAQRSACTCAEPPSPWCACRPEWGLAMSSSRQRRLLTGRPMAAMPRGCCAVQAEEAACTVADRCWLGFMSAGLGMLCECQWCMSYCSWGDEAN